MLYFLISLTIVNTIILIINIFSIFKIINLKRYMKDISNYLFFIRNKIDNNHDETSSFLDENKDIKKTLETLSSSINRTLQLNTRMSNEKVLPTPQISDMIQTTIREQIMTETLLTKGQKSIKGGSLERIVENVIKTYPNIDEEFITKKVLATIESNK